MNRPDDIDFPFGILNFSINGVPSGGTVTINVYVDYNPHIYDYVKLNQFTSNWDNLRGIVSHIGITKTKITFQLTDGDTYDGDGLANGHIDDPGGPAVKMLAKAIPVLDSFTMVLLASLLVIYGWIAVRKLNLNKSVES